MAARGVPRLFVGNLPWTVGSREVREYFSHFGFVSSANVVFERETGLSKGFGFVQFGDKEGYVNATSKEAHSLEGNTIALMPAQLS